MISVLLKIKFFAEAAPSDKDWEKCFVRVINSMDNEAVAKALCCCEILPENAYNSLKDILTVYRISYLMVKVILCIDKSDFDKLCYHICNREQVKQLSDLYHGKNLHCYTVAIAGSICMQVPKR